MPNVVDFIFPEITEWREAKKILDNKLLGKIISVNVDWKFLSYDIKNQIKSWKTDVEQGGGVLSFYFSHVFYYLEYFLNRIKKLDYTYSSSYTGINKVDTEINMKLLFENEILTLLL